MESQTLRSANGFWVSGDTIFTSKYQAQLHSSKNNTAMHYNFFDNDWRSFDKTKIQQQPLDALYKQRALMLREKYDYLILYFSGGADSYNVLRTFIDNGIHLDEVCVKWATRTLDRTNPVYTPNTTDLSAYNYLSEWDYAIEPVLKELARTNPEIKINILNWLDDRFVQNPEFFFDNVNHWHDIELPSLYTWSDSEKILADKGKSVGAIYGADKPYVIRKNNFYYMYFVDGCTAMGQNNPDNPHTAEFFYWSPECRILAYEMAYAIAKAQKHNPEFHNIGFTDDRTRNQVLYQQQQKKYRSVLYTNWPNYFQVFKPERLDRTDKHAWMLKDPTLSTYVDAYFRVMNERLKPINDKFIATSNGTKMYKNITTSWFLLCSDDDV